VLADRRDDDDTALLQAAGCYAVVPDPLADEPLRSILARLVERRNEALVTRVRAGQEPPPLRLETLASESRVTQKLFQLAGRVASSDTSLLLLGETGSGKDWLARAIHGDSPRAAGPFVAINCGAVPEGLLESELFGHERGAFTGAIRARRGQFELAHRGTLYLDEVAEMPQHLQVKLLRVLQDRTVQRLGSESLLEVDVRIIAATNRDLTAAMKEGQFRQDLYYRLAVVTLELPPLRERHEDIPALVSTYLEQFGQKLGRSDLRGMTPAASAALEAYDWPGNVRELINVIERAVLLCEDDVLDLVDLPVEISRIPSPVMADGHVLVDEIDAWLERPLDQGRQALADAFERRYLEGLLERHRGNVAQTAQQAGIDPRTLYSKMRRLGLRKETFKATKRSRR